MVNKEMHFDKKNLDRALIITTLITCVLIVFLVFVLYNQPSMIGAVTYNSTPGSTVVIYVLFNETCNLSLYEDWNLVSIPCVPDDSLVTSVMASISSNLLSVHYYDILDPADPWKSYKPGLPSWVIQDIVNLNETVGYWIRVSTNTSLIVEGTMRSPRWFNVYKGWNLVGFPRNLTLGITSALSSLDGSYTSVHTYNVSDTTDPWKVYNPNIDPQFNDLNEMSPYFGYWMNVTQDDLWKVPAW